MSHIKNYLEDISVELGYDGEINDHVRREGEVRLRSSEHQVGKGDKYEDDQFTVPMDGQVLCRLRCMVEEAVQMLYYNPNDHAVDYGEVGNAKYKMKELIQHGVVMALDVLKKTAETLHLDWDEVVQQESTDFERVRIDQIMRGEGR